MLDLNGALYQSGWWVWAKFALALLIISTFGTVRASSPAVRVLLQHCHRLTYFKAPQEWTSNPEEALSFDDPATALQFFRERGMQDIQLVLRFNLMRTFRPGRGDGPHLHLRQEVEDQAEVRP